VVEAVTWEPSYWLAKVVALCLIQERTKAESLGDVVMEVVAKVVALCLIQESANLVVVEDAVVKKVVEATMQGRSPIVTFPYKSTILYKLKVILIWVYGEKLNKSY
jgi:hypothetical protein